MKNVAKVSLKPVMYVTKNMKENSLMHLKKLALACFAHFQFSTLKRGHRLKS
jgi:hypothetical protein